MTLDNVFNFFITIIGRVFLWFYNLEVPLGGVLSVPLGDILVSFVLLGVVIRIFFYFCDFTNIFIGRDDDGRKISTIKYDRNGRHVVNYHDNYSSIQKARKGAN